MFCFLKQLISKQPSSCCADKADTKSPSKYAVYIYYPNPNSGSGPKWRRVGATRCAKRAVKQAKLLHKKQEYQKVEVKKCSYHENEDRTSCKTIRVYNKKQDAPWEKYMRSLCVSS